MELWKAIAQLYPNARPLVDYELRDDGDGRGAYIARWALPQPRPTTQQLADAIAAYDAAQTAREQAAQQLRQTVVSLATSAVGVSVASLTAAQVRALLVVLLRKAGALNADGTVRPLGDWD